MSPKKDILGRLLEIEKSAVKTIAEADDIETVEALKVSLIGRRGGRLSQILKKISNLEPETRREVGAESNRIKNVITEALSLARERLALAKENQIDLADFTLPGRQTWEASEHPIIRVIDEIWQIFQSMGFTRVRGPEIDTEWYNFEALNTPLDHPAADEQDTLYLKGSGLLRSHTSPVQIRTLEKHDPPVRVLAPGIVYRRDTYDATHTPSFHQIEGLVVDEGISFVDFKATLAEFSRRFWGPNTRVRFRPSFFPFTEPSAEVDVRRIVM